MVDQVGGQIGILRPFDENGTFIGDRTKLLPVSGKFLKIPSDRMGMEELKGLERVVRMMCPTG